MVSAQETSNKGTDFWIAYPAHVDTTASKMTLFITSQLNCVVTIIAGGQALPEVVVQANKAKSVIIDPTIYKNVYIESSEVIESKKGIQVKSDHPIIVYSHISHSFRSAATLVFPTKVLGTDYYSVNYIQQSKKTEPGYSQFTIVGVEDGTEIEIIPTKKSKTSGHQENAPFTIKLNKGDVYQYQSSTDLSGSRIHSIKDCIPFAVFSGSSFTYFCESTINRPYADSGDNLFQQLLPITAWGKNFVTAPFYNALHGSTDIFRIIVATDNTTITVNGSTSVANKTPLSNPYAKGSIVTFNSNDGNVISADKPISVAQLQTSEGCNINDYTVPGDPEMTILNPIEQTLKDYNVYSAASVPQAVTSITKHFINIVIKTSDIGNFTIDGLTFPADTFKVIKGSEYSYMVADVTTSADVNPTHRLKSGGGFSAIAYGYGIPESYGYLAGTDLKTLNDFTPVIEAHNAEDNKIVKKGLVGLPYKFILTLPYITNSLVWDFGDGNVFTNPTPVYTEEMDKKNKIYKYEYTGSFSTSGKHNVVVHAINPAPVKCDADEAIEFLFDIPAPDPRTVDFYNKVQIWDYDCMDFDSVSVKLNGVQLGPKALGTQLFRAYETPESTFSLDLKPGDNKLEIHAINEGVNPFNSVCILLIGDRTRRKVYLKLKAGETTVLNLTKYE